MKVNKKLFLVVNVDWFFLSHRLPIAVEAQKRGYEVTIFAIEEGNKGDEIRSYGFHFIPIPTQRSSTNIFQELKVLYFLYRHYKKGKPDIIHHVAMKPVAYGSIAAKLAKAPRVVNALSGLGFLFINSNKNKYVHWLVNRLFKFGFKNPNLRFILQNTDDLQLIKQLNLLQEHQIYLIKGSGVDLKEYTFSEEQRNGTLGVILPARMLWDKGISEFVDAASRLEKYKEKVQFILAGGVDMGNKAGIEERQLQEWDKSENIKWIGYQKDMVNLLKKSHIVVLPSYREGLPKSLIEACAVGRAIVTTNVPGCREVVEDGINGFLVEEKNSKDLALKIEQLIINGNLRREMGRAGRKKAEEEFTLQNVLDKTFQIYES